MSAVVNKMDMQQIEFRAVIKFLTKQGKGPQAMISEMKAVYGEQCPGKTMIYKWCSLFQMGREMIEDKPRALSLKRNTCNRRKRQAPAPPSNASDDASSLKHGICNRRKRREAPSPPSNVFDDSFIDKIQNELLDAEAEL